MTKSIGEEERVKEIVKETLDAFSKLSGVGERKLMKYGEAFIAVIKTAEQEQLG